MTADLETLQRQIHEFVTVDQRHHERALCRKDVQSTDAGFDNGFVGADNDVALLEHDQCGQHTDHEDCPDDRPKYGPTEFSQE